MKILIALNASHFHLSKEKLKKLDHSLQLSKNVYRYIPKEHWHIKLLQLSDVPPEKLAELKIKLQEISFRHEEFFLKLNGLWAYPNQNEARVLWIGVQNSIALRKIQTDVAETLLSEKDNWSDNDYKPTLPILRFRNHHNVTDMISPYKGMDFGKIPFHSLVLLEMIKPGAFPEYKKIAEISLIKKEKPLSITGQAF